MKKLKIHIYVDYPEDALSAFLSYASGITSLDLTVTMKKSYFTSKKLLWNIIKMKELEKLWIDFEKVDVDYLDHFVNELAISCRKLRSVRLISNVLIFFQQNLYNLIKLKA